MPHKKKGYRNTFQGIFAPHCGREQNTSSLFYMEAKFFYSQKLLSSTTLFCILVVNLFFTVLSRANPMDKETIVKNSGLPGAKKISLNKCICTLQIHRKQIKCCQYWLLNEADWGYTVEKDTAAGKVSNCPMFCSCERILLPPTSKNFRVPPPQFCFFLLSSTGSVEQKLLFTSPPSLNKSLCHSHIPSTSYCNRFLFQIFFPCVAG